MEIEYPNDTDIQQTNLIAVELFDTDNDPDQAPPTMENAKLLIGLNKNNFICIKENNKVIAWSVVLPTSTENKDKFLSKEITEKDLFEYSVNKPKFESLYLMGVIVLTEYRNKGLGYELLKKQIEYFKNNFSINDFYAMTLSEEGVGLLSKTEIKLNIKIPFVVKT